MMRHYLFLFIGGLAIAFSIYHGSEFALGFATAATVLQVLIVVDEVRKRERLRRLAARSPVAYRIAVRLAKSGGRG